MIMEGAHDSGLKAQSFCLKKKVLTDMARFDHRIANTTFSIFNGRSVVLGGNNNVNRCFRWKLGSDQGRTPATKA